MATHLTGFRRRASRRPLYGSSVFVFPARLMAGRYACCANSQLAAGRLIEPRCSRGQPILAPGLALVANGGVE
jgi:hypothetical protein